jgi:hypothetical protein
MVERKERVPVCQFLCFQILEGSCLTGLLFNAEAFLKPFKSVSRKGLCEAIRYLF